MNSIKYSIDTHPIIWYFKQQKTLSLTAKNLLEKIFIGNANCYIASNVLLEIFHFSLKPKKKFNFLAFLRELTRENINIVALDKRVLSVCYKLPANLQLHDRVITATALITNSTLITKDPEIRKIKSIKTVW